MSWIAFDTEPPPTDCLLLVAGWGATDWAFNLVRYDSRERCWIDHSAGLDAEFLSGPPSALAGYSHWQRIDPPRLS